MRGVMTEKDPVYVKLPPMPQPTDYGYNLSNGRWPHDVAYQMYNRALEAWENAVKHIAQSQRISN